LKRCKNELKGPSVTREVEFGTLKVTNLGKQILMNSYRWFCCEEGQDKTFSIFYCALFSLTWLNDCSFLYVFQQGQHKGSLNQSRRHGGALVGSAARNQLGTPGRAKSLLRGVQIF